MSLHLFMLQVPMIQQPSIKDTPSPKLQQQVFAYFDQPETLQFAYDLLEEPIPLYPEHAGLLYNWQYCAAALQGKPDLALTIIQKALDAGFWWGEDYFRNDADLATLQTLPEFNRLDRTKSTIR